MVTGPRGRFALAVLAVAVAVGGCCGTGDCIKKPPCGPCEDPCNPCTWVKKEEKRPDAKPEAKPEAKPVPPSEPLGPSTPPK